MDQPSLLPVRPFGATGLTATSITVGGGPLGSMPRNFGYDVDEERGIATAAAALTGPIRALDTSVAYSGGDSERRIGAALAAVGGLPADYLLSTKITRDLDTGDFSGAEMRRAIRGSLERLGVDRVPLVYLHDPEHTTFDAAMAPDGPVAVLRELKERGTAAAIGVAGGDLALMRRYVETGVFDALLTHNRWTLLNQAADELIDLTAARGMAVVNAAAFGGGILATGAGSRTTYAYREAPAAVVDAVAGIERACARAGVPLAALALQFSTRDPRITSTVVGVSRPERVAETVELATLPIPADLFDEAAALARAVPAELLPH